MTINLSVSGDLAENLILEKESFTLNPGEDERVYFTIFANEIGTTETKINVRFIPPEGNDVGLSSTIIVIAQEGTGVNIIFPEDGSIIKGDYVSLVVETNEDSTCEYSINGGETKDVRYTGGTEHFDAIWGLEETTGDDHEVEVACTDESSNTIRASASFGIDLSELREKMIIEDIGDYEYLYSLMYSIWEEDMTSYLASYTKSDFIYTIMAYEFESVSTAQEFLEEIEEDEDDFESLSILEIQGQNVHLADLGEDLWVIIWRSDNFVIFAMGFPFFEYTDDFPDEFEPTPTPTSIIEAYLEIYPSDLVIQEPEHSLTLTKTKEITKTQNGTLEVKNTGNTDLADIELSFEGDFNVEFSHNNFVLFQGESKIITVSALNINKLDFGANTATITAQSDEGAQDTITFTIQNTFCKNGEIGSLRIDDVSIDNKDGKDKEWKLFDIIEIEMEVKNIGNENIDDVVVELGLFDSDGRNQISELEFENDDGEEIDVGRIRDGKKETATFKFRVPADFRDGDYKLAVKAYSDEEGEKNICTDTSSDLDDDFFQEIDVEKEDDEGKFLVFDNIELNPVEAKCGERAILTADTFNIGDEDQDRIKINLVNKEIGLEEFIEIISGLDKGDKETVIFDFAVPNIPENRVYQLRLSADYDYRYNVYRQSSDNAEIIQFRITGCTVTPIIKTKDTASYNNEVIYLNKEPDGEAEKGFFSKIWEEISSWFD